MSNPKTVETIVGDFTFDKAANLRKRYLVAVEVRESEFIFKGYCYLIDFAKFMVEFLGSEFDLESEL